MNLPIKMLLAGLAWFPAAGNAVWYDPSTWGRDAGSEAASRVAEESKQWRKEAEMYRQTTEELVRQLRLTVPGERMLDLWDRASSDDENVRKAALQEIERKFGVKIGEPLKATVTFMFDESKGPLRVHVFRGFTPWESQVKAEFEANSLDLNEPVRSSYYRKFSETEMKQRLTNSLSSALRELAGKPAPFVVEYKECGDESREWCGSYFMSYPESPLMPSAALSLDTDASDWELARAPNLVKHRDHLQQKANEILSSKTVQLREIAGEIADSMLEVYQWNNVSTNDLAKRIDWTVSDRKQWLFIVIPQEDFDRHKDNLSIRASVHKASDPNSLVSRENPLLIVPEQFELNPLFDDGRMSTIYGKFFWASFNMTNSELFLSDKIDNSERLNQILDKLDKLSESRAKESPTEASD